MRHPIPRETFVKEGVTSRLRFPTCELALQAAVGGSDPDTLHTLTLEVPEGDVWENENEQSFDIPKRDLRLICTLPKWIMLTSSFLVCRHDYHPKRVYSAELLCHGLHCVCPCHR